MVGEEIRTHITILGILYMVFSGIFLFVAILLFVVLTGSGILSGDPDAVIVTGAVGTILGVFFLVLSLPGLLAGYGLMKHYAWARILAIVLGILNLFNFPLGTALGAYTLWVLFTPEGQQLFSPIRQRT